MPAWMDALLTSTTTKLVIGALIASAAGLARELWQERRADERTKRREREERQRVIATEMHDLLFGLSAKFTDLKRARDAIRATMDTVGPPIEEVRLEELLEDHRRAIRAIASDLSRMRTLASRLGIPRLSKSVNEVNEQSTVLIEDLDRMTFKDYLKALKRLGEAADGVDAELAKILR